MSARRRVQRALETFGPHDMRSVSRAIGRADSYIQQYITRGSPRWLSEVDRPIVARLLGIPEDELKPPALRKSMTSVALRRDMRRDLTASHKDEERQGALNGQFNGDLLPLIPEVDIRADICQGGESPLAALAEAVGGVESRARGSRRVAKA